MKTMVDMEHLVAIRMRVDQAEELHNYGASLATAVAQSDCRFLLKLVEAQADALRRAHEFTKLNEDSLVEALSDNTLQYFRGILTG